MESRAVTSSGIFCDSPLAARFAETRGRVLYPKKHSGGERRCAQNGGVWQRTPHFLPLITSCKDAKGGRSVWSPAAFTAGKSRGFPYKANEKPLHPLAAGLLGYPAVTVETSMNLLLADRVRYQMRIVRYFLREIGLV